jgi:hypothetical protein
MYGNRTRKMSPKSKNSEGLTIRFGVPFRKHHERGQDWIIGTSQNNSAIDVDIIDNAVAKLEAGRVEDLDCHDGLPVGRNTLNQNTP